jgi:hypothetical protein
MELYEIEAEDRLKESAARLRRYKRDAAKTKDEIKAEIAEYRAKIAELNEQLADERADVREEETRLLSMDKPVRFRGYDAAPEGTVGDIAAWSREFRRRCWGAAFSGGFEGKRGTSDLFVALALGHLMESQGARLIDADIAEVVRVTAMDYKTVERSLESLRGAGMLLRTAKTQYALVADSLPPLDQSPEVPASGLAERLFLGDRSHDAFGGKQGVGATETRAWAWMLLHPCANRLDLSKGAGVARNTAYEAVKSLQEAGLAAVDENGLCRALASDRPAKRWLDTHRDRHLKALDGKGAKRVKRATDPFRQRGAAEGRVTPRTELDMELPQDD